MPKKIESKSDNKSKIQFIDEQTQPFIRYMQKRIKTRNKKLLQINQLNKKDKLKPDQIQKVNKKQIYLQQIQTYTQFIDIYKQVLIDNSQYYIEQQFKYINLIIQTLSINQLGHNLQTAKQLLSLLTQTPKKPFKQHVTNISSQIKKLLTNPKVLANIRHFSQEIDNAENQDAQEKVVKQICQDAPKIEDIILNQQSVPVIPTESEVKIEIPQVQVQQKAEQKIQAKPEKKALDQKQSQIKQTPKQVGKQGVRQVARQGGNHYVKRVKKTYKPKYQQKQQLKQKAQNQQQQSSQSSEQQVRTFKKEQIKKLKDNGFQIVGSIKPRARDQKEQHDKEHGKKHHHHHKSGRYN